jgi:hypothetical protein
VPGLKGAGHQGPDDGIRISEVTLEAITGGIFELCVDCAISGQITRLPELVPVATYFALTPLIGAEQAAAVASAPEPPPAGARS